VAALLGESVPPKARGLIHIFRDSVLSQR